MQSSIPGFPLGLEEKRDPFAVAAAPVGAGLCFVYLTGRRTSSWLFPACPPEQILDEADQAIPMGYTQLWILEWRGAVASSLHKKAKPAAQRAVEALHQEAVQAGASWPLLGENGAYFGWAESAATALAAAQVLAARHRTRIAVGRLLADVAWH